MSARIEVYGFGPIGKFKDLPEVVSRVIESGRESLLEDRVDLQGLEIGTVVEIRMITSGHQNIFLHYIRGGGLEMYRVVSDGAQRWIELVNSRQKFDIEPNCIFVSGEVEVQGLRGVITGIGTFLDELGFERDDGMVVGVRLY